MKTYAFSSLFLFFLPILAYCQQVTQDPVPPISVGDHQLIASYLFDRQGDPTFRIDSCRLDFFSLSGSPTLDGTESLAAIYLEINGMPYSSWHTTEAVVDPLFHFPTYLVGLNEEETALFEYFADVSGTYPFGIEYSCLIREYPNGSSFWTPVLSSSVPVSVNSSLPKNEIDVYSFEGGVTIRASEEFVLYNMLGNSVYSGGRQGLFSRIFLPGGVYILVSHAGARKIYVK